MSKSDEILYELDYTKRICIYDKEEIYRERFLNTKNEEIMFDLYNKVINITTTAGEIDMKLLKAINEKCKELGWLDEQ